MIIMLALAAAPLASWFEPLHPDDSRPMAGVECDVSDSRGRLLLSFGDNYPDTAMRIGGRLVRFRVAGSVAGVEERFHGPAGRLRLRYLHPQHHGADDPARLSFTDPGGHAHSAVVLVNCDA